VSASPARILIVDDEPHITELVSTALRYEGFETEVAGDGRTALKRAAEWRPDLIVLDVMLPDLDGFAVQRRLRASGLQVPIVFLTARDATEDKLEGLRGGGDDYVTKPFSLEELIARVRSVLRRARPAAGVEPLRFADLVLDEEAHEVTRGDRAIALTATEFRLLRVLLLNRRRVLSKDQLLELVWPGGSPDPNVVETYVSYLRKKVDHRDPPLLHTVRGVGYSLRLPR
jgi:two-component system, OmpR family, response regulator